MSLRNESSDVISGFFLIMGMHIAAITIAIILAIVGSYVKFYILATPLIYGFFGIGLAQLLYVVPVIILLNQRQRWGLMKGVIIGAVITAFLNGGCWLLVFAGSR